MIVCISSLACCPCVGSLYPLYEDGDLITESGLEGQWRFVDTEGEEPDPDAADILTVSKLGNPPETIFGMDIPPNLPASLYTPGDLPTYRLEPYTMEQAGKADECVKDGQEPEACEADESKPDDESAHFRLVELKGKRFVDIVGEPNAMLVAPSHWFGRIRKTDTGFEVNLLDFTWLVNYIEKKPRALKYEVLPIAEGRDAWLLLTTKPKALQKFLLKHYDTPEAWMPLGRFERVAPEKAEEK